MLPDMTDAEKIAAIDVILQDMKKLADHITRTSRHQHIAFAGVTNVIEAEATALRKVAKVMGVDWPMFASLDHPR